MAAVSLAAAALLGTTFDASAELRRGEKSFGPRIGYCGANSSVMAGRTFQYSLSRVVRLAPEADVVFRNNDKDAISVALNVQFPFGFEQDKVALYPFVGPTYVSWGLHNRNENKDVTTHANRFGMNAGGGVEFRATSSLKLSLEGRYTFVKDYCGAQVNLGIMFVF